MRVKSETVEKIVKIYDKEGRVVREETTKVTKTFEEESSAVGIGILKRTEASPSVDTSPYNPYKTMWY